MDKEVAMQQTIKLKTDVIRAAAEASGTTPENFVAESRSIVLGYKVCAHLKKTEGPYSFFSLSRGVRTLRARGASRKSAQS